MSTMQEQLGKKVRQHRKQNNYSTADFAQILGVSVGLINNIENARNDVFKLNLLMKVTKELNLPITKFLGLNEVDVTSVKLNNDSNLALTHHDLNVFDSECIETINFYLTQIMKAFISTVITNKYDKEKIIALGECIKHDIKTISKLSKIS